MVCQCRRHLPRQNDVFIDDSDDEGALRNAKKTYLTRTEMAIRLREVHNTLVPNFGATTDLKSIPEWKKEGMKLNIFLLEKAANMCGLNGQKFSRWYSVSRWGKENNNPLSFEEFQSIIERYAQAGRNTEKTRSLIDLCYVPICKLILCKKLYSTYIFGYRFKEKVCSGAPARRGFSNAVGRR